MNNRFFKRRVDQPTRKTRLELLREQEARARRKRLYRLLLIAWFVIGTFSTIYLVVDFFTTYEFRSPVIERRREYISPLPTKPPGRAKPTPTIEASVNPPITEAIYQGKVSYYSSTGCLGCSDGQVMGNGEVFDENRMTLAVPCEDVINRVIRYNTSVRVINIDNGKEVVGTITDCGGFSKYNRVADLSLAMATVLGAVTDVSNIKIELL